MTFLSLYRKYRPRTFEDLVGQQHVVQTLKNALNQNRIGHAYLFAGPRGTGKTSTAKIFAQALNCVEGPTVDPCGVCDSCSSIISGQSVDVIEIDAASNRGIDEIRDLREKVKFLPTVGKYKVYIIDEVHMLTKGAFNALLKTLEEPPSNVVFILATTEAHKVLDTILSRCQRFDFTLLSSADIVSRLEYICQQEKVDYDREALNLITGASMGGLRDAISLLDQAISYTDGNLTREAIQEMLGKVDLSFLRSFVEGVLARDTAAILKMTGEIIDSGKSISVFVEDLINFLHQAMLLKECGRDTSIFNLTEEMYSQLEGVARGVDTARLIRFLDILTEVERQLPFADQPRIILELGLIKMTAGTGDNQLADLENRLRELEEKVEELSRGNLSAVAAARPVEGKTAAARTTAPGDAFTAEDSFPESAAARSKVTGRSSPASKGAAAERVDIETAGPDRPEEAGVSAAPQAAGDGSAAACSIEDIRDKYWPVILQKIKEKSISTNALLIEGTPAAIQDKKLFIQFPDDKGFHRSGAEKQAAFIQKVIAQVTGFSFTPVFISESEIAGFKKKGTADNKTVPARQGEGQQGTVVDRVVKAFNGKIIKVDYDVLKDKENEQGV